MTWLLQGSWMLPFDLESERFGWKSTGICTKGEKAHRGGNLVSRHYAGLRKPVLYLTTRTKVYELCSACVPKIHTTAGLYRWMLERFMCLATVHELWQFTTRSFLYKRHIALSMHRTVINKQFNNSSKEILVNLILSNGEPLNLDWKITLLKALAAMMHEYINHMAYTPCIMYLALRSCLYCMYRWLSPCVVPLRYALVQPGRV